MAKNAYIKILETVILKTAEALQKGDFYKTELHPKIGLFKGDLEIVNNAIRYLEERGGGHADKEIKRLQDARAEFASYDQEHGL